MWCGKGTFLLLTACSVSTLKRSVDCFVITVLFLIMITLIYLPEGTHRRARRETLEEARYGRYGQVFLSVEDLTDDGFTFAAKPGARTRIKYISYEPPIGSWSKQLLAFENAVIFAKLLNRTLLVYPLISEMEGKRLKKIVQNNLEPDAHVYDMMDRKYTVPISSVIDLYILRKLIHVQPIHGSHRQFLQEFGNATWYDVCHKEALGFWMDFIPSPKNSQAWAMLDAQNFATVASSLSGVEPICEQELEMMGDAQNPNPFVRGILSELALVTEDVIYFRGGSLAMADIRFLSKERALAAQKWASHYIRFTPYMLDKIRGIVEKIKKPFNALLITEEDMAMIKNTVNFRLREMQKRKFLEVSNRLFVVTKWENSTLLEPLRRQGYNLHVTSNIIPLGIEPHLKQDVANFLGQLICKYARHFAGPADSYLIQRARVHEAQTKEGLLTDHVTVRWAGHTVGRKYIVEAPKKSADSGVTNSTDVAQRIACVTCKFIQRRSKFEMCQSIMKECSRKRLSV